MRRRIVLPGGSGFLGSHLAPLLAARGDDVVILTRARERERDGVRFVHWDGATPGRWVDEVDGADAIVHLAGKRVDCRPTRANVDELIRSRVESVRVTGEAVRACRRPPPVWVQLSTMAVYGDAGDRVLDEEVPPSGLGPRQMVAVALAWEAAFRQAARSVGRTVLLRAGIAIGGEHDPATARLATLARLGLAGPVAGGDQWVSWVALDDLLRIILRAVDDDGMEGLYLATGPAPTTNAELMRAYRAAVGRRVGLPSPVLVTTIGAWLLGSDPALATTGRRGLPRRLLADGFVFRTADVRAAVHAAVDAAG